MEEELQSLKGGGQGRERQGAVDGREGERWSAEVLLALVALDSV